jgi:hypothetical protein
LKGVVQDMTRASATMKSMAQRRTASRYRPISI